MHMFAGRGVKFAFTGPFLPLELKDALASCDTLDHLRLLLSRMHSKCIG
jgi:hypothetical protein